MLLSTINWSNEGNKNLITLIKEHYKLSNYVNLAAI